MKGYRFYKEYDSPKNKRFDIPNGNVFARSIDTDIYIIMGSEYGVEGYGAVYYEPNSPCVFVSASLSWLQRYTKRISEREAREIHPNLFKRIED